MAQKVNKSPLNNPAAVVDKNKAPVSKQTVGDIQIQPLQPTKTGGGKATTKSTMSKSAVSQISLMTKGTAATTATAPSTVTFSGDSGQSLMLSDEQTEIIKREHQRVMREERTHRSILCLILFVAFVFVIGLAVAGFVTNKRIPVEQKRPIETEAGSTTENSTSEESTTLMHTSTPTTTNVKLDPLPNLTYECAKQYGECFYHMDRKPDDCKQTKCATILVKFGQQNSWAMDDVQKMIDVPAQTYCDRGKWCMGGQCVQSDDPRLLEPDPMPFSGGFRHNCDNLFCVDDEVKKYLRPWLKCPKTKEECANRLLKKRANDPEAHIFSVQLLTLNDPFPVRHRVRAPPVRLVIYEYCDVCGPPTYGKTGFEQPSKDRPPAEAHPCPTGVNWTAYPSFFRPRLPADDGPNPYLDCLPLFKQVPESYGVSRSKLKQC